MKIKVNIKQLDQSFPQYNRINKVIKLRLYPTTELLERFPQLSGNERWVWNRCISFNTMFHQLYPDAPALDRYDLVQLLKVWKRMHPWLKVNDATGLQKTVEQYAISFKNMLKYFKALQQNKHPRKVGFPHYRSLRRDLCGFSGKVVSNNLHVVDATHLKLPKFKQPIRVNSTISLTGWKIKEYRVKQLGDQTFEINLFVVGDSQAMLHTGKITGVDCNLKNLVTLSNGKTILTLNNNHIRTLQLRKTLYQRKMSRAYNRAKQIMAQEEYNKQLQQHSLMDFKNYWKYRRMFNVYNLKLKRIKKYYLNQISNYLVQNYDVIVFEKLNIQNMTKNHHVARSILEASWYELRQMTEYKALWNNKLCITVAPQYTTQKCHHCGFTHGKDDAEENKIGPSERSWQCPRCGHTLRRDQNAAINILQKFLDQPSKYFRELTTKHRLNDARAYANNRTTYLWKQVIDQYSLIFTD